MSPATEQPSPQSRRCTPPPDDEDHAAARRPRVLPAAWPTDLVSLGYAAYFPLVLVAAVSAPLAATTVADVSVLTAVRYAFLAAVVAYVVGLAALLR